MANFFRAMLSCKDAIYSNRDRSAAAVYSRVQTIVENGSYSTYKNVKVLAQMKLRKCTDGAIASRLGIEPATVRNHCMSVSNDLYRLFGKNFFDLLSNFSQNREKVLSAVERAESAGGSAFDYILSDVLTLVGEEPATPMPIEDCDKELDFLACYSRSFLSSSVSSIDLGKVAYLISVLNGDAGSSSEWKLISDRLNGGIKK
jgi:hypothetical protein